MTNNYFSMPVPLEYADDFYHYYLTAKKRTAEPPPLPKDDRYNPNMTFGEAMAKQITPPNNGGMIPTWTDKTRTKYRVCIQPSLNKYMIAVEKINRLAQEKYSEENEKYVSQSIGIGGLSGLVNAFTGNTGVTVRYNWKGTNIVTGGDAKATGARVVFWISFIWGTKNYINIMMKAHRQDKESFIEETEIFFTQVNQCRRENPYDTWILKTVEEQRFDDIIYYPSYIKHPYRWMTLPR